MVSRDPPTSSNPSIYDVFLQICVWLVASVGSSLKILPRNQMDLLQTFEKSDSAKDMPFLLELVFCSCSWNKTFMTMDIN